MFSIRFASSAARQLEKIAQVDRKLYLRVIVLIESLRANPWQGKRLKGRFQGDYSLRVGDYRIIYRVDKDCLVVIIIDLGHRREVYR